MLLKHMLFHIIFSPRPVIILNILSPFVFTIVPSFASYLWNKKWHLTETTLRIIGSLEVVSNPKRKSRSCLKRLEPFIRLKETGVVSSVGKRVDIIIITNNRHNLFMLYLHIYHSSFSHNLLFHSLIYFTNDYSTVTEATQPYRSMRWALKDRFSFKYLLITVREAGLIS